MTDKRQAPGFLRRPPKLHPITAFTIGAIGILAGVVIEGSVGGGLIGGGICCLLMGVWDTFRLITGMVRKPNEDSTHLSNNIQP